MSVMNEVVRKCCNCGFENKNNAKFCTKCGNSLEATESVSKSSDNTKYIIIGLIVVIMLFL